MSDQAETPTANAAKRGGRRLWWIIIGSAIVLLLLYAASPYYTLWRFEQVLRSSDHRQMESYVDFPSVRASLKEQLHAKLPRADNDAARERKQDRFAGLLERLAPSLIDQLVDAFVTPDGLAALIADPRLAKQAKKKDPAVIVQAGTSDRQFDSSQVKYAFFTGARDFLVDVQGTKLRFRFSKFRWILRRVELPLDALKL